MRARPGRVAAEETTPPPSAEADRHRILDRFRDEMIADIQAARAHREGRFAAERAAEARRVGAERAAAEARRVIRQRAIDGGKQLFGLYDWSFHQ